MQLKRLIWAIAALLTLSALAGCATPEEAGDNATDDNLTDGNGTQNGEDDDAEVPPPSNHTANDTDEGIDELTDPNESET